MMGVQDEPKTEKMPPACSADLRYESLYATRHVLTSPCTVIWLAPYLCLGNQAKIAPPNGEIDGEEAGKSGTQAMHKQCISNTSVYDTGVSPQAGRVVTRTRGWVLRSDRSWMMRQLPSSLIERH
jgi:hypothetical protein